MEKEELEKLLKIPGKTRGQVLITDFEYVKEKEGEKGVELLKKKIKEWGDLIDYEKVKATEWYPVGLRAISLLAIKETFGWGDEEIKDLGNSAPKYSFIVKMLLKYFLSLKRSVEETPTYWAKHYTVGRLEPVILDEEKKYLVLRLHDFKIHPILCTYYLGYFLRFGQYVIKSDKITIEETKCMFKGDPFHEFVVKWE